VLVHRRDPEQRRLAAAVRSEHDPVLTSGDVERDPIEDAASVPFEHDIVHGEWIRAGRSIVDTISRRRTVIGG
jgi:hypothetical protein